MDRLASTKLRLRRSGLPVPQVNLCVRLVEFLEGLPPQQAEFLTLPDFSSGLGDQQAIDELLSALSILSTLENAPLSAHGYLHESEDELVPIPDEDFTILLCEGELVHPKYGEPVDRPMERVHLYYRLEG
ncbi:hypothetical protein KUV57_10730 [Epibacterium sp. DP7N7-1]|nr:hypothetical protein [Epibacterium sp. DP7N7-1]